MGFFMRKTQMLLSPFNSQPAVFARVCLLAPKSGSKTPLHRSHHRKSTNVELNLLPLLDLSLTHHHPRRRSATLKSP